MSMRKKKFSRTLDRKFSLKNFLIDSHYKTIFVSVRLACSSYNVFEFGLQFCVESSKSAPCMEIDGPLYINITFSYDANLASFINNRCCVKHSWGVYEQYSISWWYWISVGVDDWRDECVIVTSNFVFKQ